MNPVELLEFYTKKNIKPILQSEKAECGLACLAMIATNHGYNISIAELREPRIQIISAPLMVKR